MEASVSSSPEGHRSPGRRYGLQFSTANLIQAPLSALIEYSGILRGRQGRHEAELLVPSAVDSGGDTASGFRERTNDPSGGGAEVSIRIIGSGERENVGVLATEVEAGIGGEVAPTTATGREAVGEVVRPSSPMDGTRGTVSSAGEADSGHEAMAPGGGGGRDSSYQRYDIHQLARWIEQILPFTLLLLVVFIRQHLQGFVVTFWIAAVMIKSNDILQKQTALKGERKISVLIGICLVFVLHITGVYWWYRNSDLLCPLLMLPPASIPPFWHAIFIIVVNDTMARQVAMLVKCMILVFYKNSRGRDYRKQVNATGDLCAICQEKMHAPILLRCKHIFCEDCVSEWFERERTCPLCRALVKPPDLKSFGDGSASLFFQLF